jgi:hypothetical protein
MVTLNPIHPLPKKTTINMKITLILLTALLSSGASASETTLHETPIYKTDGGAQIGTLKQGVDTEAGKTLPSGYAPILIQVDSAPNGTHTLKAGSKLLLKSFSFGEVTEAVTLDYGLSPEVEAFRAFVKVKDLNPASIPERALEKTLAAQKNPTLKSLDIFIKHFHFRDDSQTKKFTRLMIDTNLGAGLATSHRLHLIFQKDVLAGVIHLYDLKLKGGTDEKLHDGSNLIWLLKNKADHAEFIKEYNQHVDTTG